MQGKIQLTALRKRSFVHTDNLIRQKVSHSERKGFVKCFISDMLHKMFHFHFMKLLLYELTKTAN